MSVRRIFGASLLVVCLLAAIVTLGGERPGTPRADAAEPEPDVTEPPPPRGPGNEDREPFQLYGSDPGAATFEELSPEDKEAVERAQEWAEVDHGHEVHQAWSKAARDAVLRAQIHAAELAAGLEGIGELGVQ